MQKQFHDIHAGEDGVFNTESGTLVSLNNPTSESLRIDDIINALSKLCRFNGHVRHFYSVAQHSVLVSALAPVHLKKAALLHDATEAYLGDVIKPLKNKLGGMYHNYEMKFMAEICIKFGLDPEEMTVGVKPYDKEALTLEHELFQKGNYGPFISKMTDLGLCIDPFAWDHNAARFEFNKAYSRLFDIDLHLLRWN